MNIKSMSELRGSHILSGVGYYDCDISNKSNFPAKYGWFVIDNIKYDVYFDECEGAGTMLCPGLKMHIPKEHEKNIDNMMVLCDVDLDFIKIYCSDGTTPILITGTTVEDNIPEFVFDYTPENI